MSITATASDLGFLFCLKAAAETPEFVREYDRLRGTNLSRQGSPLALAIDDACCRIEGEFAGFAEFVREFVWLRLPPDVRAELDPLA